MNPEFARFQPPEEPKQKLRLVEGGETESALEAVFEKPKDDSLEFPVLKQAKANFLEAQEAFHYAKEDLSEAKKELKEAEEDLREARRVPGESRTAEIRTDLERLRRMVTSENDPEYRALEEDLAQAEDDEDPELRAEEIAECEASYADALEQFQDAMRDVEAAQVEMLTHKRILDHVQNQSFSVFGLWGRMRKIFLPTTPKKEQEISIEPEDDDRSLKEAA